MTSARPATSQQRADALTRCPAAIGRRACQRYSAAMGRIVTRVSVASTVEPLKGLTCDALVDTGSTGLVLPRAWKDRLGALISLRTVEMETADQRAVQGEICGPV